MKLGLLDAQHPAYCAQVEIWEDVDALYHGGAWVDARLSKFLPPNPQEPSDVYETRKREAAYIGYIAPIINYFVSWLFSGEFQVQAKNAETNEVLPTDAKYTAFQADVGGDVNLNEFIRQRASEAMRKQCAHWLIELPTVDYMDAERIRTKEMPLLEYEERELGAAKLCPIQRDQIYDWATDEHGKLLWCIIHECEEVRDDPRSENREMCVETWRLFDAQTVETFVYEYKKGERSRDPDFDVPTLGRIPHRFRELPLVTLDIGDGLWIGERMRKPQIEHFRLSVAKSWLIRRTCYAMPVLKMEDPTARPDIMGAGYYISLGQNDSFDWTAPPNAPFDVIQQSIDNQRDEMYRIVHQMAQGLDNNADTVGRSADSKQIDTASTRIMLNAYGSYVRKAIEETYEILSDALGDTDVYFTVVGFSGYDTATASELIANATDAQLLGIPSKTFRQEMKIKVALALHPEADPAMREAMRKEIREAIDQMPDIEELDLPVADHTKVKIQELKGDTALKVEDKKSKTALAKPAPKPGL